MSDDWFTEYVYEVAVPKALLPAEYLKALEEPATMLPAWGTDGRIGQIARGARAGQYAPSE